MGFESVDLRVRRGQHLLSGFCHLTFYRILDNFINPSGPLLIKRIIYFCCTCPPHLEMVRGFIRWKEICRHGQFCALGSQEKCGSCSC